MEKITAKDIGRIFAMRIGSRITYQSYGGWLQGVDCRGDDIYLHLELDAFERNRWVLFSDKDPIKLSLYSTLQISDDDAIEIAKMADVSDSDRAYMIYIGRGTVDFHFNNITPYDGSGYDNVKSRAIICNVWVLHATMLFQFLVKSGYDVKMAIAPGHPLNGKTAVELGFGTIENK